MVEDPSKPLHESDNSFQFLVTKMERLATEQSKRLALFSDWATLFKPIEDITDEFVNKRIAEYSGNCGALIEVIKSRRDRLSLTTGITDQIVGICQQILSFGAAGLALTIGFIDKLKQFSVLVQKVLTIVGIFYFELVLLSLLVLIWYMLQARFRFPSLYFEKIGNAWPFFYYATITPVPRGPIQISSQRFSASVAYANDFARFTDKLFAEDEKLQLRAELQQYFLLISYQAYINQFSLRLASIFTYGFVAALATLVVMICGLLVGFL
jgi:hypothetical protein